MKGRGDELGEGANTPYKHTGYLGTLGEAEGDLSELLISVGLYVA